MFPYLETVEKSIEDHPAFRTPRNDWRVRKAYVDEETGEVVPEDRTNWRPEEDGKCLADFYDFTKKMMRNDSPMPGVSTFLAVEKRPV
jgi:hypothetical protein